MHEMHAFILAADTFKLHKTHPEGYRHFDQGLHVVRRSDRFWVGLSPDLVIEQVLMRSMKTSGGLTRCRGMTETQRLVWLMAHPFCAEVNNAMQQLIESRNPFSDNCSLPALRQESMLSSV